MIEEEAPTNAEYAKAEDPRLLELAALERRANSKAIEASTEEGSKWQAQAMIAVAGSQGPDSRFWSEADEFIDGIVEDKYDPTQADVLRTKLVKEATESGNIKRAVQAASKVKDKEARAQAYLNIAAVEGENSPALTESLKTARSLPLGIERAQLLSGAAKITEPGPKRSALWQEAITTVNPDGQMGIVGLSFVKSAIESHDLDIAWQIADKEPNNNFKSAAYHEIAVEAAKSGSLDEAVKILKKDIMDEGWRNQTYGEIVIEAASQGRLSLAHKLTNDLAGQYPDSKHAPHYELSRSYAAIAEAEGKESPVWDKAIQEVNALVKGGKLMRDQAVEAITHGAIKVGNLKLALEMAPKSDWYIEQYGDPAPIFQEISKAAIDNGEPEIAQQAAQVAEAKGWKFVKQAAQIYGELAYRAGPSSPLWEKIQQLGKSDWDRAEYLIQIARNQPADSVVWGKIQTILISLEAGAEASIRSVDEEVIYDSSYDMLDERYKMLTEAAANQGIFSIAYDAASKIGYEEHQLRAYLAIASAEGPNSLAWKELEGFDLYEDAYLSRVIINGAIKNGQLDKALLIMDRLRKKGDAAHPESYLSIARAAHEQLTELAGRDLSTSPESASGAQPTQQRRIGNLAIEHWKSFKNYDATTFARLANGASEIANAYMEPDERKAFIRHLAEEFRNFRDSGMFEDGRHMAVAKDLAEALVNVDDPGATGDLLQTLYGNMGEAVGLRLIKQLVETGNSKAGAAALNVFFNQETPQHAYQYLLHKLTATGFLDSTLPQTILELQIYVKNIPAIDSRMIMSRLYSELGIQCDSTTLRFAIAELDKNGYAPGDKLKLEAALAKFIERVKDQKKLFEQLPAGELLEHLNKTSDDSMLYFLLKGGKTSYALINHYSYEKFKAAIEASNSVRKEVIPEAFDIELCGGNQQWHRAMLERRRPADNLVWEVQVGQSSVELSRAACTEFKQVAGSQLKWLLVQPELPPNFEGFNEQKLLPLPEKTDRRLNNLLGDQLSAIMRGESETTPSIGDIEKMKPGLINAMRELRKSSKSDNPQQSQDWKSLIEEVEASDPVRSLRALPSILSRNPALALRPQGAMAEWVGHLDGLGTSLREARVAGAEQRQITLRWLDNKEDLCEVLRFADGAQCCFTSVNTGDGGMDPGGIYKSRISQDPHWFTIAIEDTPKDSEQRVASGFVFGSLARVDGQPALALNGVYMQRKTDAAANKILGEIFERVAQPLGITQMLVASIHGGTTRLDSNKWQPADGHRLIRPRAIGYSLDSLETETYDDIGGKVNQEYTIDDNHLWLRR